MTSGVEIWIPVLLVACEAAMAVLLLWIAGAAADGRTPRRDPTDANAWERRSIVWASEETWAAAHRAQGPYLRIGGLGFAAAAVVTLVAAVVVGTDAAFGVLMGVLLGACAWGLVWLAVALVAGHRAAREVYAAAQRARLERD